MPLAGFEPAIPARQRPQTYALDCGTTGICEIYPLVKIIAAEFQTINGTDILLCVMIVGII
jgi:hypothetical protein